MKRLKVVVTETRQHVPGMDDLVSHEWKCPLCPQWEDQLFTGVMDAVNRASSHVLYFHNVDRDYVKVKIKKEK